ncbi:hypothetical protein [Candidatus Phytoplasma solani]|uniref:hypothetical protein n=1 Tax=Candidatus Phytoplasma solani TaxID=69896 RepID=UPI0035901630
MQFSIGRVISFIFLSLLFLIIWLVVVVCICNSTPEMSKLYEKVVTEVQNQISNRVYDEKFLIDAVIKEHELRVQFFKKNTIYLIISFLACIFVPGYICFSGKKEPKFVFTQAPPYPPQNPYPLQYPPRY